MRGSRIKLPEMRHVQYHTRITGLPFSVILPCSQVFLLPSCRSLPSQSANSQSVQWSVGRAIHLSFKTTNKHTSFFSLSRFNTSPLLVPYPNTSLHPLCVVGCLNGPSSFSIGFFSLGLFLMFVCCFRKFSFGLPRIRDYRPGRFPSYAFVSAVVAPLPNISSLIFIQPACGVVSKTEGQERSQIK